MDKVNICIQSLENIERLKKSLSLRSKMDMETGCIEWTSYLNDAGYGIVSCGRRFPRMRAHRVGWALVNGPIPEDLCLCHKCDNRKCINPEHLFLGTKSDNTQDMISKGRHFTPFKGLEPFFKLNPDKAKRGESNGNSKFTEDFIKELRDFEGSHKQAAEYFDIPHSTAWQIRTYRTWKHVK